MTSSTSWARAAANSSASARGADRHVVVEHERAQPLPERRAARLAALDHVVPLRAQPRGQAAGLRRLADPVETLEGHEHRWSLGAPADDDRR